MKTTFRATILTWLGCGLLCTACGQQQNKEADMKITECMWKAHDGQQPDKE